MRVIGSSAHAGPIVGVIVDTIVGDIVVELVGAGVAITLTTIHNPISAPWRRMSQHRIRDVALFQHESYRPSRAKPQNLGDVEEMKKFSIEQQLLAEDR